MVKKNMIEILKNVVYWSFNFFLRILYTFFLFLPIDSKKIFINCFDGEGINDSPKYIFKELKKIDPEIHAAFFIKNGVKVDRSFKNEKAVKLNSLQSIYEMATSKIWISTVRMPIYSVKRKKQWYIQTWHGCIALKRIEKDTQRTLSSRYLAQAKYDSKQIDYFFSNSDFATNLFQNSFWYTGQVKRIGSPRMDLIVNHSEVNDTVKEKIGIEKGVKLLLYAPTFRNHGSFSHYELNFDKLIERLELSTNERWVIGIRLHPRIARMAVNHFKFSEKLINLSDFPDIQLLMIGTDALITDYSSVMFDFMQTNRPIWLYADDIESYRFERSFYFEFRELPFSLATTQNELEKNIKEYKRPEYLYKKGIFERNLGIDNNGNAAKKAAIFVRKLMKG
ncbi:CDP-glycerol glycerophosphotransferase family protein [Pediococcus inopinatus]|uniref:CDP-glycerol glycerophosphotransferase family protein n=1 Tax=Pediococcus inopinatus TaxID=114090 RepID=UPI0007C4BDB0|nr:CDP-glycerol glycerophosphotransferase family protein [Pediococcus inopinatus]